MTNGRQPVGKMDLNHLHPHVRNLVRAQRFYESYFLFRERVRHGDILFLRNTNGFDLALAPDRTPFSFPDWFHFGFRLGSGHAARKLHNRMISEGVQIEGIEEHYVSECCADH